MPERLLTEALLEQLKQVSLFRDLDAAVLSKIAASSRLQAFPR